MDLQTLITTAILRLAPALTEDHARAETIGQAIADATAHAICHGGWRDLGCDRVWRQSGRELAALLVTQAYFESGFVRRVHAGRCLDYECDPLRLPTGRVVHQARGLWQIHASGPVTTEQWRGLAGLDYTRTNAAAYTAAGLLGAWEAKCRSIEGAISGFATGQRCAWRGTKRRMIVYRRALGWLSG